MLCYIILYIILFDIFGETHYFYVGNQNKLPPWLTSISEGSVEGVGILLGQSLKPDGSAPAVLLDRAHMAKKLLDEGTCE